MASRKDKKGRVLRKGESFRITDEMYVYAYTDPFGKRRYIYSKDLVKLRKQESKESIKSNRKFKQIIECDPGRKQHRQHLRLRTCNNILHKHVRK